MIRRAFIQNKVLETYRMFPQIAFPFNVYAAFSKMDNVRFISYQDSAELTGHSVEDVIKFCQSKSGCTRYDVKQDRYVVYCNLDPDINVGRKRWTAAHELGHIMLGHLTNETIEQIAENNLNKEECGVMFEREADFFAATLLCPFPLFRELDVRTSKDIRNVFGLSIEASRIRIDEYYKWRDTRIKTAWDNDLLRTFRYGTRVPGKAVSEYVEPYEVAAAPHHYSFDYFLDHDFCDLTGFGSDDPDSMRKSSDLLE